MFLRLYSSLELLEKATRADIGVVRSRKDGDWKKISATKWVKVPEQKSEGRQTSDMWRKAQKHFDYAMASTLGDSLEKVLTNRGITSFQELSESIMSGEQRIASDIYRDVLNELRAVNAPISWKKDLADNVGRSLLALRDLYNRETKATLTVPVESKTGSTYYKYKEDSGKVKVTGELPALKPTVVNEAKKSLAGWNVNSELTSDKVNKMLDTGTAILVSGKIHPNRKWVLPKKAEDMDLKYKGDSLGITVKQVTNKKGAQRQSTLAKVTIKLPYAVAKSFLWNQIASVRTRNNFIFRMERSKGYKEFLEGAQIGKEKISGVSNNSRSNYREEPA